MTSASTVALQRPIPAASLPSFVGFFFAARLAISYLFFQSDPQTGAMVSVALNYALLVGVLFYTFGAEERYSIVLQTQPVRWVMVFLAFSLMSLLWSATVSIAVALGYWAGMAADVVCVLLLLRTDATATTAMALLAGFVAGACFIAAVAWLSTPMQDLRPGNDEFFSPNAIGWTCAFGALLAQILACARKSWRWAAALLALSLLRSLSKTTIIAFVAAQAYLLLFDSTINWLRKWMVMGATVSVLALFSGLIADYWVVYTHAGNQAETLTGRIGIWAFVLERAFQQPWIGHGFHSFRNVIPPFGTFEAWHAHNELIQQFYAYGVCGLAMLAGLYGSFWWQARQVGNIRMRSLFTGLLLFILVRGFGDTERFDLSFPLWSIVALSSLMAHIQSGNLSGESAPPSSAGASL